LLLKQTALTAFFLFTIRLFFFKDGLKRDSGDGNILSCTVAMLVIFIDQMEK
jgi:hypothetical protein